jgi:hypothetical protein
MLAFWTPDESSGEIIAARELEAVAARGAVADWQAARGARHFPLAPDQVMEPVHANTILVRVISDGEDYEYCSVGEDLVAGFGENFFGRRLSDIEASTPRFGLGLRMLYEMARASGEFLCYRGWAGADMPGAQFVYYESAILPFGRNEAQVDHVLVVSVLVLRDQASLPKNLRA